jgi:hypothetical protein
MLHLFIRARRDSQSYGNEWIGDFRVKSIKTYETVADYCRGAMDSGAKVRIHRRRFERIPATICCECTVKSVMREPDGFRVEFENWRSLSIETDRRLQQGYYFADPSDYETPKDLSVEDPFGDAG